MDARLRDVRVWAHVNSVENIFLRLTTIKSLASTAIATNIASQKPKVDTNRQSELKCSEREMCVKQMLEAGGNQDRDAMISWSAPHIHIHLMTCIFISHFFNCSFLFVFFLFFFLFVSVSLALVSLLQGLARHFSMPMNASKAYSYLYRQTQANKEQKKEKRSTKSEYNSWTNEITWNCFGNYPITKHALIRKTVLTTYSTRERERGNSGYVCCDLLEFPMLTRAGFVPWLLRHHRRLSKQPAYMSCSNEKRIRCVMKLM